MSQADCEYCERYNAAIRKVQATTTTTTGTMNIKTKVLFAIALLSIAYNFGMYHMFQDKLTKATSIESQQNSFVVRTTPYPGIQSGLVPTSVYKPKSLDDIDADPKVNQFERKSKTREEIEEGRRGPLGFVGKLIKGASDLFSPKEKSDSADGEFDGDGEIGFESSRQRGAEGPRPGAVKGVPAAVPGAAGATGLPSFPHLEGQGNSENGAQLVDLVKQPDSGYKPLAKAPQGKTDVKPEQPEADLPQLNSVDFEDRNTMIVNRIPLKGMTLPPLKPIMSVAPPMSLGDQRLTVPPASLSLQKKPEAGGLAPTAPVQGLPQPAVGPPGVDKNSPGVSDVDLSDVPEDTPESVDGVNSLPGMVASNVQGNPQPGKAAGPAVPTLPLQAIPTQPPLALGANNGNSDKPLTTLKVLINPKAPNTLTSNNQGQMSDPRGLPAQVQPGNSPGALPGVGGLSTGHVPVQGNIPLPNPPRQEVQSPGRRDPADTNSPHDPALVHKRSISEKIPDTNQPMKVDFNQVKDPHGDILQLIADVKEDREITPAPSDGMERTTPFSWKSEMEKLGSPVNKIILLYTPFFRDVNWEMSLSDNVFKRLQCPVSSCALTSNLYVAEHADAVMFHMRDWENEVPQIRHPHQRYVFFTLESPLVDPFKKRLTQIFNWTMSYRLDSDIHAQYGMVQKKQEPVAEVDYISRINKKTRPIAWMVSNCRTSSMREKYVQELQVHMEVDIYGDCGSFKCQRDLIGSDRKCMSIVNNTYWFYLSFESTLCEDYITEKYYMALGLDVVPIVRGMADYSKVTPGKWYINTDDFKSPKELANYLQFLMDNPIEYSKYLKGKEQYTIKPFYGVSELPAWCDLCAKLHANEPPVQKDLSNWWSDELHCRKPKDVEAWFGGIIAATEKVKIENPTRPTAIPADNRPSNATSLVN